MAAEITEGIDEALALAELHEAIRTYNRARSKGIGWHVIRVSSEDLDSQRATLEIDGRPLLGVRELRIGMKAGGVNRVTLELDALVDVELPADVEAQLQPCPRPHIEGTVELDWGSLPDLEDVADAELVDEDREALNLAGGSTSAFPDTPCPCGAPLLGCLTLQGGGRGRCCESCVHT